MRASEVMTTSPVCCTADTSLQDVARLMVENQCGAIPVVDNSNTMKPVGIVTDRDIVCRSVAEGKDPMRLSARDVMTPKVTTVRQDLDLNACCKTMEDDQVRRLVVVDDRGMCCGIISQADVARTGDEHIAAEVLQKVSMPDSIPSRPAMH